MRIVLLVSLLLTCSTTASAQEGVNHRHSSWRRTVEINSTFIVEDIPEKSKNISIWIPYPMETPYQEIKDIKINFPCSYDLNSDEKYGNRMIHVTISDPPGKLELNMDYTINRFENQGGVMGTETIDKMAWTLEPARLIPLSPVVEERARSYTNPDDSNKKKARSLYDHTVSYMNYDKTGEGWGNGDWQYACDFRKGNCTDYHSYFIGLCRNIDIPSYFEIGYSVSAGETEGEIPGYHCWSYFWDEKNWVPVDISEGDKHKEKLNYYFGNHDPNRIALSRGRDITLVPPQKGAPLNFFVFPYAEVDGKKHEKINLNLTFKEITDL